MITLILTAGAPNAKQNKWELQMPLVQGGQSGFEMEQWPRRGFWSIFCLYELFLCFEPSRSQESVLADTPLSRGVGVAGLQRSFQPQRSCDPVYLFSSLFIPGLSLLILPSGTNELRSSHQVVLKPTPSLSTVTVCYGRSRLVHSNSIQAIVNHLP